MTQVSETLDLAKLGRSLTRAEASKLVEHGLPVRWHVLLGIGQSIIVGGGGVGATQETLPGEPDAPLDGLWMLTTEGNVVPAKTPTSELDLGLAVDPLFHAAKALKPRLGRTDQILIVNAALGGSGFSSNDWNPGDPAYSTAMARAAAALAIDGATMLAIMWVQGVQDSNSIDNARAHGPAFVAMVEAIRGGDLVDDLNGGHETLPIVVGTTAEKEPGSLIINQNYFAAEVNLPYLAVVDCRDLVYPDAIHPDVPSRRIMGRRLAAGYFQALANRGASDGARHVPTPVARVLATSSVIDFSSLEVTTPLGNSTPDVAPVLVNVSSGAPFTGASGFSGAPRGNVIAFNAGGFRLANHLILSKGFTFAAWIWASATARDMPILAPATLQAGGTLDNPGFLIRLEYDQTVTVNGAPRTLYRIRAHGPISGAIESEAMLASGIWTHLTVVNVPTSGSGGDFYVFLNGVLVASWVQAPVPALEMQVGVVTTDYANSFAGYMDDVRCWNTGLGPSQVVAVYRESMSPTGGGGTFPTT